MKERLRTLKEVAEIVRQEPHRVIHLCECRVVVPKIGADGRGSVRRFSRDDIFRIRLGLTLQDSGLSVSQIKPVMVQLAPSENLGTFGPFLYLKISTRSI